MLKCKFCTELAIFECSGNRFCLNHRSHHDSTHKGLHNFKDIFCKFSKQGKVEFRNEISKRLTTLRESKKLFAVATSEHIKYVQTLLSQKLAKIDEMSQFYTKLIMKKPFDKSDAEMVDKIFSTKLVLKPLVSFTDTNFKDYIQQEIIESEELVLGNLKYEGKIKSLSFEGKFLFEVIMCCEPKNIPERILERI